jgi:nicotinate-nucleotide pyrophosphorylase (carboxylating)
MTKHIDALVSAALKEDVGDGDITAALIPADAQAQAKLICREAAVLCGVPWFDATFKAVDASINIGWKAKEGEKLEPDQTVCEIKGNARSILTAERTAINLLQSLSGTASVSRRYAEKLAGLKTRVLDTRKTIPGMRMAQKYASKIGGAVNHRLGLYDGVLIKENHIRAAGSIAQAIEQALATTLPNTLLEVEVESIAELSIALEAGAKRVLLDNFSLNQLQEAVEITAGRAALEASGNVTLQIIREIAETGVDYISVGALTKHLHAVDFSLQFELQL